MTDAAVETIREQMAFIRVRAHRQADKLGEETRQFLDWKHYVRLFPWGALAAAAAIGYFVVPRRIRVTRPDAETLAQLAREQRLVIAPAETAPQRKPGMIESAFNLLGNTLLRAGIAYAGQQVGKILAAQGGKQFDPGENRHAANFHP
jgi:hypothetical protein